MVDVDVFNRFERFPFLQALGSAGNYGYINNYLYYKIKDVLYCKIQAQLALLAVRRENLEKRNPLYLYG